MCRAGIETLGPRTDVWTHRRKKRVRRIKRAALTYIHHCVVYMCVYLHIY